MMRKMEGSEVRLEKRGGIRGVVLVTPPCLWWKDSNYWFGIILGWVLSCQVRGSFPPTLAAMNKINFTSLFFFSQRSLLNVPFWGRHCLLLTPILCLVIDKIDKGLVWLVVVRGGGDMMAGDSC